MKMLATILSCSAILLSTSPVTAAEISEDRFETVVFEGEVSRGSHFNWFKDDAHVLNGVRQAMLEPLFLFNSSTGEIDGWLAKDYEYSDNFSKLKITLNRQLHWSTVSPHTHLEAADLKFSLDIAITAQGISDPYALRVRQTVKSVEVEDRWTVNLLLDPPDPNLVLDAFSASDGGSFAIVPKHVWGADGVDPETYVNPEPIGTGPYILESRNDHTWVWKRNDRWWGNSMNLPERMIWTTVASPESRLKHLANGKIDVSAPIDAASLLGVMASNPNIRSQVPIAGEPEIAAACPITLEFFAGENNPVGRTTRQAVNHAIDRKFVAYEFAGHPELGSGHLLRAHPKNRDLLSLIKPLFAPISGNPEMVKTILEADGYSLVDSSTLEGCESVSIGECVGAEEPVCGGRYGMGSMPIYARSIDEETEKLSVPILVDGSDPRSIAAARAASQSLCDFGIFSEIEENTGEALKQQLDQGNFSTFLSAPSCDFAVSSVPHLAYLEDGIGQWSGETATTFSVALAAARAEAVLSSEHIEAVANAYEHIVSDVPTTPITQMDLILPINTQYWTGWPLGEDGLDLDLSSQQMHRLWLNLELNSNLN